MAKGDEITTKFKVDISDLKKGIADANQQIKLANAEFKAATAGMDDWSKSAEGIQAKLSQLDSVLAAQKSKLEAYTEQLKRQQEAYNENGSRIEQLKAKLEELANAGVSKASDEYKKYEDALASCEKAQDGNAKAIDNLKVQVLNQKAAVNETEAEIKKYGDSMDEAEDDAKELDTAIDDLNDSSKEAGGGFDAMTVALGNMIAEGIRKAVDAIKDFVAETINVGKEFDASMSQVQATSGATGEEMAQLRDKAKEMGENTKFSATEASEAFNYMAMAGWKTGDMLDGITGILNLAAAGNTDLATTSDIVTDALTAFGKEADQAGRLADIMASASSNANTNVTMMGETFKYVAPVAGAMGYSMEDTAVAIGLMANAGIKGSQAGTSLRSALTNMVNPTEQMSEKMEELGLATDTVTKSIDSEKLKAAQANYEKKVLSLEQAQNKYNAAVEKYGANSEQAKNALINVQKATIDLETAQNKLNIEQQGSIETHTKTNELLKDQEGNMRPLSEVLQILREKFKGLSEEEQAQAAATLFGKEAMSGMLGIINASDDDFKKLTDAINNSKDSAQNMAEVMQDNLEGDLTKLHSKLESVQLHLYEKFEPALRDGVKALTEMLDGVKGLIDQGAEFINWLNSGSTEAELLKAAIIAIVAAFAGFQIVSAITGLIQGLQAAFAALNAVMMANPIGLVVAAIAALVAGFMYLWNNCEEFRNFWINLWEKIKEVAQAVADWFKQAWDDTVKFFTGLWDGVKNVVETVINWIKDNWQGLLLFIVNPLAGTFKIIYDNFEGFRNFVDGIVNSVKEFFTGLWESIQQTFVSIGDWFKEKFESARQGINTAFEDVGTWFADRWTDIQNAWETVGDWFNEKMTAARDWTNKAFEDVGNWFADRRKDVETAWTGIDKWMGDNFGSAWEAVKKAFSPFVDYFKMIWENVKQIYSAVESVLKGDFEGAWNAIKGIWDNVKGYFKGIWDGIVEIFDVAKKWFGEKFSSAWEAIKEAFSPITKWFSDAWAGIQKVFSGAAQWFGSVFDKVGQAIKAPLNAVIRGMNFVIRGLNKISIDIPDWVPGVGGKTFGFSIGEIPELARGGVLRKGQVGLLEGRGDEAVVPLDQNKAWIKSIADELIDALNIRVGANGASALANNKQMTFTQNIYAPKQPSRIELYRQTRNLLNYASATL